MGLIRGGKLSRLHGGSRQQRYPAGHITHKKTKPLRLRALMTLFSLSQMCASVRVSYARRLCAQTARACLTALGMVLLLPHAPAQDVTTWHVDIARTGVQTRETQLTPANVNSDQFGKLFTFPVIGDVYAQPLYLSQYPMSDGATHNVLIVATAQDNIYAFDADGNNPPQGYLWSRSLLGPSETWATATDVNTVDINPNIGIIGTPVIDRSTGTIYVVAKSKDSGGATPQFYQRLHALNVADGSEKLNGPTLIAANVPGSGDGSTTVAFDPFLQNQRAALLLAPTPGVGCGNSLFIAWGSHGDKGNYRGWIMAYDAADVSRQSGAWTTTPNGHGGGVWMSGGGISSDGKGSIFAASGNGTFDADPNQGDYGDSAFRLTLSPSGLNVADFFTPANQSSLDSGDHDMGMSAMVLLPPLPGPLPHLAVTSDKNGTLYLVNRDSMGGYNASANSSLQTLSTGYHVHSSAAFFNSKVYIGLDNGPLQAWTINTSTDQLVPQSFTSTTFSTPAWSGGGGTPSFSANGTSKGIAWILQDTQYNYGPAVLHAYNAADLSKELYNSQQASNGRDTAAIAVKFTTPTIANGHVYVGGRNAVTAYGLFNANNAAPLTAPPAFQPAPGTYAGPQTITLTDATPDASIYYTTNGSIPTASSTLYTGPIPVTRSQSIKAIAIASGSSQSTYAVGSYNLRPAGQQQVSLDSAFNTIALFSDGAQVSSSGLDGSGNAYSANQIGSTLTLFGVRFVLGSPNQNDMVSGASASVVPLPAGPYNKLQLVGTAIHRDQTGVVFTVTYTDGTVTRFTQNMSPWTAPRNHSGESIAWSGTYADTSSGGSLQQNAYLYRYSFTLDSGKTLQSITLPANSEVAIAAISMLSN